MQISILGTDGAYLANDGSNAISILGPDGNLLPNDGTHFVCVTGSDGAYQPNDGTREAFSILGTDGALLSYVEGNSFSVLDENGALAIPVTDNLISPLLWGGAQGAWYDPSDLSTMFTTAGGQAPVTSTGQSCGLLLDKRLLLAEGAELTHLTTSTTGTVTDNGDGTWTLGASSSIRFNFALASLVNGAWYRGRFTMSASTGTVTADWCDFSTGSVVNGTCTAYGFRTTYDATFRFFDIATSAGGSATITAPTIKSIAGNHAYQTTSGSRPIFRDVAGLRYLEFDGVDDYLRATFTIAQPIDRVSAIRQSTWTSGDMLFAGSGVAAGSLYQITGTPRLDMSSGGTAITLAPQLALSTNGVITESHNGASSRLALNSGAYAAADAGATAPAGITIGANQSAGAPSNMHLYQLIMRGSTTAMTDAQISACRALCSAKSGVTL